jgi:hypothetical protein
LHRSLYFRVSNYLNVAVKLIKTFEEAVETSEKTFSSKV